MHVFDTNFKMIEKFNLDQTKDNSEKTKLLWNYVFERKKCFFVVNAATDEISLYDDKNLKLIEKIKFSNKVNEIKEDNVILMILQ